jgi:rare lipoprotein A
MAAFSDEGSRSQSASRENPLKKFFLTGLIMVSLLTPPLSAAQALAADRQGIASYYGQKFHGRKTASGERYDHSAMTAAHRTAPFGSQLRVTNLSNGRSVIVRVNDRGPWVRGRVVDVSGVAARQLGMTGRGLTRVSVSPL